MNLYFHVPFCRNKCGYCAFYSLPGAGRETMDAYLKRIELQLASRHGLEAETVYVGGGTPTMLPLGYLKRFFGLIKTHLRILPGAEITVEANPETLTPAKVEAVRSFATRLSLGVQSFNPRLRRLIGRRCGNAALRRAFELVRQANFPHFGIDLIYGIPGESASDWEDDLRRASECGCDHVSCYALTAEEGAALAPGFELDDEAAADMWKSAGKILKTAGFRRYEVSNYARRGAECRHNLSVWRGGLLTAFGPSAAGFDGTERRKEVSSLAGWLAGEPPETDAISTGKRLNEIFAVNLRTVAGWNPQLWSEVPHCDSWETRLRLAKDAASRTPGSWWHLNENNIRLTAAGLSFWDSAAEELL